jgi:hypothetical protein
MKQYAIILVALFFGCKSSSYHYRTPTINATPLSRAGETLVGIQGGSAGIAAKAAYAFTKNINVNGWASFFPEGDDSYNSREVELSLGFQTNQRNRRITAVYLGWGNGDNELDKIGLAGSYNRPFIQIQRARFMGHLHRERGFFDGYYGLRVNYLMYNGKLEANEFDDDYFYYEPYAGAAFGTNKVRLEFVTGFSIKGSKWKEGVRLFPFWANLGLIMNFGKKY